MVHLLACSATPVPVSADAAAVGVGVLHADSSSRGSGSRVYATACCSVVHQSQRSLDSVITVLVPMLHMTPATFATMINSDPSSACVPAFSPPLDLTIVSRSNVCLLHHFVF